MAEENIEASCQLLFTTLLHPSQLKYVFQLEENVSCKGDNNLNFRLARDQVLHLETAANLWASLRFFSRNFLFLSLSWEDKKHLMTGPIEGLGETNLTVSRGPSH